MKREMDLIRLLLLQVEGQNIDLSSYSEEEITYHKALLLDAELCEGATACDENGNAVDVHIIRLTWKGHDFIEAAKNDKIWAKVRSKIINIGGGFTLNLLMELLKKELKDTLGLT